MSEASGSIGGGHILGIKAGRRTSIGGFVIIEDDDFRNAMGKLMGIIPLTADPVPVGGDSESDGGARAPE